MGEEVSDTVDQVDPGVWLVPSSTGENTTETFAVFYPFDGLLVTGYPDADSAIWDVEHVNPRTPWVIEGARAVKVTLERIDP